MMTMMMMMMARMTVVVSVTFPAMRWPHMTWTVLSDQCDGDNENADPRDSVSSSSHEGWKCSSRVLARRCPDEHVGDRHRLPGLVM